jgi:hypothetical protein
VNIPALLSQLEERSPLFDVPTTWEELSDLTTPEDLVGVSSEDIARMRD